MKNLFTGSLDSRLLKYSVAAGVTLWGAKELKAQVIYTDPADLVNVSQFTIDFNGDATVDLGVRADLGTPSDGVARDDVRLIWGKVRGYYYYYAHHASALNTGTSIGPGDNFGGNDQFICSGSAGQWPGANSKLLGVKFTISGQTHYGWVRMSCSASGPFKFTVYDYAYESTPNTAINGGVLPVELNSFTANTNNNAVDLKWNTETEVNNYGFEILRSTQNDNWEKVGFVKGAGNSNTTKSYSFTDKTIESGTYSYRLKQIDVDGSFKYSKEVEVKVNNLPAEFTLQQNYPNPFNPATTIKYALPSEQNVSLKIYNMLGQEVATLVNKQQAAGNYEVKFDAAKLASGVYIYRLEAGSFSEIKKMDLLK